MFCDKNRFDVICLCETWLYKEILDGEIPLPGYELYRDERQFNAITGQSSHGGVLIAVKKDICSFPQPKIIEGVVSCIIKLPNETVDLLIVCAYNPPDDSPYRYSREQMLSFLEYIMMKSKTHHVFCYDDFNLKHIDWNAMESENMEQQEFVEKLFEANLRQHVSFATCGNSLLDLVIASPNIKIGDLSKFKNKVSPQSDHIPIICNIYLSQVNVIYRENARRVFSFCRTDFNALSNYITCNPFVTKCWSNTSVLAYYWQTWLHGAISAIVPKRTRHRAKLNPWISPQSSNLMKKIETIERNPRPGAEKILTLKSKLNDQLDRDLATYQEELANSRSSEALFKNFRMLRRSDLPPVLQLGNKTVNSDLDKATIFADFFHSVYTVSSEPNLIPSEGETIESFELTEHLVATILEGLDPKKATGPDGIPMLILKKLNKELSHSLHPIFQKIKQTSEFPHNWKCATVIPVHKKDSKIDVKNYRPVSLLICVSKVFERCVYLPLYEFLRSKFSASQHGFRKGRSCVTQLLHFLDQVYKGLESGQKVEVIYTDFEKAFDKVDHGVLLSKLYHYGVRGKLLKLIESYLKGRTFRVRVGDSFSTPRSATSGVPQGSLLGPLFFLVLINDFEDN